MSRRLWWLALQLARVRRRRLRGRVEGAEEVIPGYARAKSFADIGCMWNIHGRLAFLAADSGAAEVVGVDYMDPTPEFLAEQSRRGSPVRFVKGDFHDPAVAAEIGEVDVVFCSGVLYHSPNPLLTLESLRGICRETLLLWTATVPEIPGVRNGCVFLPHLDERTRRMYDRFWPGHLTGVSERFDPAAGYDNWFWALSPSAVRSMLEASGFAVERQWGQPFTTSFVARRA